MYATIDMDRMVFTHVHAEPWVLSMLAHLELPHSSVKTIPLDYPRALNTLTDLELKLLWRNTTGTDLTGYMRDSHLRHVAALMEAVAMNPINVDRLLLSAQSAAVGMDDGSGVYRYTPGARFAVKAEDYLPAPLRVTAPEPMAQKRLEALMHETESNVLSDLQAIAATNAAANRVAAPRDHTSPSGPRSPSGSVAPVVYQVADCMWEAAGSPKEVPTVLKLRKDIMNELEAKHGVKRSTASNTLAQWQKARLNG